MEKMILTWSGLGRVEGVFVSFVGGVGREVGLG
jgi:hypothetical protein